jgi:isopenicillin N synthase-like dioxygenase
MFEQKVKADIPTVDMAEYLSGNPMMKQKFVQELGKAYEEYGFVKVKNHGVDQKLIKNLYKRVEQFFTQSDEDKKSYEVPEVCGQRGYTSFGREKAKGSETFDLKEFYQHGQLLPKRNKFGYPSNVKVTTVRGFTRSMDQAYENFENSGRILLRAIANYLNLDENYFDDKIENGNSILRAIHYPPITQEPLSAIRAEQHEDINLITLLVGASADGLQVMNKQGEWIDVVALEDQIVVNVGDMLQRLTNDKLKSTTHRVVNPPKEKWGTPRYSIPFFLHPKADVKLNCLESCVTDSNPKKYDDSTAGEYLDERLREIGLKN